MLMKLRKLRIGRPSVPRIALQTARGDVAFGKLILLLSRNVSECIGAGKRRHLRLVQGI